jgi:hypothetical protein
VSGERTNDKLHVGKPTECLPGTGLGGKGGHKHSTVRDAENNSQFINM